MFTSESNVAEIEESQESFDLSERLANQIFGLNVVFWGVVGLASSSPIDRWTVVRVFIALQHFVVGGLLFARSPVGVGGSLGHLLSAIPSIVLCGVAFKNSPLPHAWPLWSQVAFAIATSFAVVSLLFLGKNFAIFPALRRISTRGPYRLVRHPIYLAELSMVVATVSAGPNLWALAALAILAPALVWRILSEEQMLLTQDSYQRYRGLVRYRLIPGLW